MSQRCYQRANKDRWCDGGHRHRKAAVRQRLMGPAAILICILVSLIVVPASASELKDETVAAYDRYVRATEARMKEDLETNGFLAMDRLPENRRQKAYDRVRGGELYIQQLHTREGEHGIEIPSGLVHHWVAVIFVPGGTLSDAVQVLEDYDTHQEIYKPEVRRSKLLESNGGDAKIYLQFYIKSIVTAVFNANFEVTYDEPSAGRYEITSRSFRVAEVEDLGKPREHELPVGKDRGFLWRLNTYWRVEEKDGGVYLQNEAIALTRRVPPIVAWFVNPLLQSIPKELLSKLLFGTSRGMAQRKNNSNMIHDESKDRATRFRRFSFGPQGLAGGVVCESGTRCGRAAGPRCSGMTEFETGADFAAGDGCAADGLSGRGNS